MPEPTYDAQLGRYRSAGDRQLLRNHRSPRHIYRAGSFVEVLTRPFIGPEGESCVEVHVAGDFFDVPVSKLADPTEKEAA
jgi:hypothetical protein